MAQKSSEAPTAEQFVQLCQQQHGKPYQWGATGPATFDCSGLVHWAAAQLGVVLPRTAAELEQQAMTLGATLSVAQATATRGALLLAQGHVAVSLGDGTTIEAAGGAAGKVINWFADPPAHGRPALPHPYHLGCYVAALDYTPSPDGEDPSGSSVRA